MRGLEVLIVALAVTCSLQALASDLLNSGTAPSLTAAAPSGETGLQGIFMPLAGRSLSCAGGSARVTSDGTPQVSYSGAYGSWGWMTPPTRSPEMLGRCSAKTGSGYACVDVTQLGMRVSTGTPPSWSEVVQCTMTWPLN
jgi:hypothetical protein